jgi:hypothetical protein
LIRSAAQTYRSRVRTRRPAVGGERDAEAQAWGWQWAGWASWPVTPAVLGVAVVAVALDVASAWAGWPSWAIGSVLVSPALPVAAVLVALIGGARIGVARASLSAWREVLVGGAVAVLVVALAYVQSIAGWREIGGVALATTGEEIVYRLAVVLLIGAACARAAGRDWRDTARWGTGPVVVAIVGAAVVFSVLPGHVQQMTGAASVVPFACLAVLLGYAALRTGSLVPGVVVHVLLDLVTLAFFADRISASARMAVAATALTGLMSGLMVAGRRLGLRRRMPAMIDLRDPVARVALDPTTG